MAKWRELGPRAVEQDAAQAQNALGAIVGQAMNAVSKSAAVRLTRVLGFELGQWGFTCNSFGARPIMTDLIKGGQQPRIDAAVQNLAIKRPGTCGDDRGHVCDFFIAPTSDTITDQLLSLGGIT
jgi:NAD(P)-dependent dehydrogenase (short-subunit alcohol dehydrogenase family)